MAAPSDDLRTGKWVTVVDGSARSLEIRRCRLAVISGPDAGKTAEIESSWIRVGASDDCDLVIADPRVSGSHLEIQLDDRGYRLRDLDSTNGTFVSGHRIAEIYLNPGTVIALGDSRIRFEPLRRSVQVPLSSRTRMGGLVGGSPGMRAVYAQIERVAPTDASVLITGETGTGKELVAEAIHDHSARAGGPFVIIDCGSVARNLIEGELFGYERGAFTGATQSHAGAFERADGGTVFLDELGELPIELQPKLLGALERREVRRLGGNRPIKFDIRVIAATHRDLLREMNRGLFREDLYYRLAVVRIRVPPLRERLEDVAALAEHFLSLIPGGAQVNLKPETIENLERHDYPGNVRELRNLIERSVVMADEDMLARTTPLPSPVDAAGEPTEGDEVLRFPVDAGVPFKIAKRQMVAEFERRYLRQLLAEHNGNVSAAARAAGLDRMTVHKMLNRAGIER